ncbi:unnamed protein product [Spirodela intermedia]|uniref:Uncharacterized protein n=2 Tax=Spirodela intermedia TaxID=51605 RepID=A0A7I8LEZ1_SPIIN|nr:unnamed protein product [Spirodela intermedia]CAA6671146.1 unnamed protein product [Spirodela intermedia]CAA7408256.1 unnamed protein product [Spirodela intermedia]
MTEKQQPERRAVLTAPLSLEGGLTAEHRTPTIVQRVLGLFRSVRPGTDLTHFQLPPQFNLPKSQLQCYGESVYCIAGDILRQCARGETSLERLTAVVAWSISMVRPLAFGQAPFNPVLGETHHVSRGSLNVLLEQVSHHPPVSALHATDAEAKVELVWCQNAVPKFNGTSVEVVIRGERRLNLLSHGESYELSVPALMIKFLPVPGTEWSGIVRIRCRESDLEAELCYHRSHSFLGLGGNSRAVKGKIFRSQTGETLREIHGHWNSKITMKDVFSGKISVLYDAKEAISKLHPPILKDPKGLLSTESAVVWADVSEAVVGRDWDRARVAKRRVEERERRLRAERDASGEIWAPRFFRVTPNKDGGWECRPIAPEVPPAPIVVSV